MASSPIRARAVDPREATPQPVRPATAGSAVARQGVRWPVALQGGFR